MKKIIATATLLAASTAAFAGPYAGIGYEASHARIERNSLRSPVIDGTALSLPRSEEQGGLKLLAGYQFNDSWALELGFSQAEVERSREVRLDATRDEEWESSIDGRHFTLAPVYLHQLGERLELRATAGLSYGDYDIEQVHRIDVDNGPDQLISRVKDNDSKFGGMVGVGLAYQTPWKVEVLGQLQHQRNSILSSTSASVGLLYRF